MHYKESPDPFRTFFVYPLTHPRMLVTLAVILLILWILGLVSSYTLGGFIHLLLVAAIILVLVRLIQGQSI